MDLATHRTAKAIARGKIMKRRLSFTLLAAACASLPLALATAGQAQAQSVMRPANSVVLSIGRGQLVSVPGAMADVFVANEAVADVQIKSQRQLYVFGKAARRDHSLCQQCWRASDLVRQYPRRLEHRERRSDDEPRHAGCQDRRHIGRQQHLSADRHCGIARRCRRSPAPGPGLCRRCDRRCRCQRWWRSWWCQASMSSAG